MKPKLGEGTLGAMSTGPQWIRSSACESGGCIEVADVDQEIVGIRDSKRSDSPVLEFTPAQWRAFSDGMLRGDFRSIKPGSRPQGEEV